MSDYLNAVHDNCTLVANRAYELRMMAKSFSNIGNFFMADQLFDIAGELLEAQTKIRGAVSEDLTNQVNTAWQSSANVLKAVVAGVALGTGDEPLIPLEVIDNMQDNKQGDTHGSGS